MTGIPEIVIDQSEADSIAKAANNVARHYNVETTQKTLDWVSLFGALGMVYGTRFGAFMLRKRQEKMEQQRPAATVYQMPMRQATPEAPARQATQPEQASHVMPEMEFEAE